MKRAMRLEALKVHFNLSKSSVPLSKKQKIEKEIESFESQRDKIEKYGVSLQMMEKEYITSKVIFIIHGRIDF